MKKFAKVISNNPIKVIIISVLLIFPALYGMFSTRINYDLLTYLPKNLDSMKGQQILEKDYSDAATSMLIVENMESKDIVKIKNQVAKVEGVNKVIWINDILDTSIPKQILPQEIKDGFYSKNSTMLIIKFNESASSDKTQNAITSIRKITNNQCFLSGVSAIVKDTKDLADKETPFYVLLAVIFSVIVLSLTMKSAIIPFIFLLEIGLAIVYNFGTNIFLGEISYVTKALAAVLQLGVTMDYSIFLLHRYDEERENFQDKHEAMAQAISKTIGSIAGSSLTTIAGFLALCVMTLGLGKDIGIVMAKGVLLGVVCTVTILPALILVFDKPIHKFSHKTLLPRFEKTADLVTNKYKLFIVLALLLFVPAIYGNNHTKVYYNLDESLPKDMKSIIATNKLKKDYNMTTTHFIIVDNNLESYKTKEMLDKIENVDGIDKVLSYNKLIGASIPEIFIPQDIKEIFKQDGYNLIIVNSKYKAARDEENRQISKINSIVKSYDKNAMVAGEGPLTKDLIEVADKDFKHVSSVSIMAIFGIILILFVSGSIPIMLVAAIQLAIFINMAIPYYTGTEIPFIASIVIGCVQLGATVDYAILMTTRFREEIRNGYDKFEAMNIAVKGSARSIVTSGFTFFAATSSVGIISNMDLIKSLCGMIARGALISMGVIIFILPSILLVFEKFIRVTSKNWDKDPKVKLNNKMA
ncbi:RND family transporter [Haloimpatiens sp. FM7330]|uniref:efflux RND transporter permease subunit n=1 Tax=Haloimpatiens sp. FM7330 TaxID=3298610 RepID=UPI00363723F7